MSGAPEEQAQSAETAESNAGTAPARADEPDGPEHPIVKEAMALFGARIVDVQPRRK